jgi:hypothetical protein
MTRERQNKKERTYGKKRYLDGRNRKKLQGKKKAEDITKAN